jgi:radical SAM superfamily enzyme YgiQ (UPF0313 family)
MKVVITADRTIASNFRQSFWIGGFFSSFPKRYWTTPFYKYLTPWCPVDKQGIFEEAPLSLRKVESSLINNDITCLSVHPKYLEKHVQDGDILAVSCVDPLGCGPVPSLVSMFFKSAANNFLKLEFENLITKIKELRKKRDFEFVVGGAGAFYLIDKMDHYGIDHVYVGEAEIDFPKFVENGHSKRVIQGKSPKVDKIYPIVNPTGGCVEISRGCGRGCKFCSLALKGSMRSIPVENISKEIHVNQRRKCADFILQTEDFLLYNSNKNLIPQTDAIMDLFKSIFSIGGINTVFPMHASFSSVLSNPDLIDKLSSFLKSKGQKTLASQPGIETGSSRLLMDTMPGKKLPFKDMEWSEVVLDSLKVLKRNGWTLVSTLILGLPNETEDDIDDTIELVKAIDYERCLVVPLLYSITKHTELKDKATLVDNHITKKHWQLIVTCWKNNFKRIPKIYGDMHHNSNILGDSFTKFGIWFLKKSFEINFEKRIEQGKSPIYSN